MTDTIVRIGLIADTHMPGSIAELWPEVFGAFAGVQAILHAGDLHTIDVINQLEVIAPTYVSRGNGDIGVHDDRIQDVWRLAFDGINVGMTHEFPSPSRARPEKLNKRLGKAFPEGAPHVVVYGHTHHEEMHAVDNTLYINPGSPTLPKNQSTRYGTLGLLEIHATHICATLLRIEAKQSAEAIAELILGRDLAA